MIRTTDALHLAASAGVARSGADRRQWATTGASTMNGIGSVSMPLFTNCAVTKRPARHLGKPTT